MSNSATAPIFLANALAFSSFQTDIARIHPVFSLTTELRRMLEKMFRREGQVFDTTNWKRKWIKACASCGERKAYGEKWWQTRGLKTRHLRQSAITNMTDAGVNQKQATEISGNKTISVFLRYNISDKQRTKDAMKKVEAFAARQQRSPWNSYAAESIFFHRVRRVSVEFSASLAHHGNCRWLDCGLSR